MKTRYSSALCCLLALAGCSSAFAAGHVLENNRISVDFADPASGYTKANADRVDSISWIDSAGASTGNLVAEGGPLHCGDPQEFFGQSYGLAANNAQPFLIISGVVSSYKSEKSNPLGAETMTNPKKFCDNPIAAATTTQYQLSNSKKLVNQMSITRSYDFKKANTEGPIRVYVPRLPLATYPIVIWPDSKGAVQRMNDGGCASDCQITDWNGAWVADDDGAGDGVVLIRDPANGPPAIILADNDGYSASNNTSIALTQPVKGWKGEVKEVEQLCFYDAKSWPAARQAAGKLPTGCAAPK
jgi:hypothetical protein